jgi:chromatin structure-remodeling complex subunit RSC9
MLLSLRSGIPSEIAWAFDRLCRLCNNEQFLFRSIPGLTNTLFEWPEWYISQNVAGSFKLTSLFTMSPSEERKRRHGLEALCIMRNAAAVNDANAEELVKHKKATPLILSALHSVQPNSDENVEFLLYVTDLFQYIAPKEVKRKKPQISAFDPNLQVGNWIEARPVSHALNKINSLARLLCNATVSSACCCSHAGRTPAGGAGHPTRA